MLWIASWFGRVRRDDAERFVRAAWRLIVDTPQANPILLRNPTVRRCTLL